MGLEMVINRLTQGLYERLVKIQITTRNGTMFKMMEVMDRKA